MIVTIYTKENCSYCTSAKAFFTIKDIKYEEKKLNKDFDRSFIVENFPTQKTFPVIVIDNNLIGGYDQLLIWYKNKENEWKTNQNLNGHLTKTNI